MANPSFVSSQDHGDAASDDQSSMEISSPSDGRERGKPSQPRSVSELLDGSTQNSQGCSSFKGSANAGPSDMDDMVMDGSDKCSYVGIAACKSPFHFTFSSEAGGSRKRSCMGISEGDRDKRIREDPLLAVDMTRDMLAALCKGSRGQNVAGSRLRVSLPVASVMDGLHALKNMGVMLYFMGRVLSARQLRDWAKAAVGENAFTTFFFLGKGIYLGICAEYKVYFDLINRVGIKGNGFLALALPWDPNFDPLHDFMLFCPVWVQLFNMPVFLMPYIEQIAEAFGKVLFLPKHDYFIPTRNVRFCVLWDMSKSIPVALEVDLGLEESYLIAVKFNSFPHACYKCHQVGHFARNCTTAATSGVKEGQQGMDIVQACEDFNKDGSGAKMQNSSQILIPTQNSFAVLQEVAGSVGAVNVDASSKGTNVVNLEEGQTLYVDLQLDASAPLHNSLRSEASSQVAKEMQYVWELQMAGNTKKDNNNSEGLIKISEQGSQPGQPQLNSVMNNQIRKDNPNHEKGHLGNFSEVVPKKGKEILNPRAEEERTLQQTSGNEQANKRIIIHLDKETVLRAQDSDRIGDGRGGKSRMANVESVVVPVDQDPRREDKENIMDDWVYEPLEMPHSFGYFDYNTGKYKIKGRLEDTPYGKKIFFRNRKVRGLKSFL